MASRAPDWGLGRYEGTAAQLLPAARVVVDRASLRPGERVVDVGCGNPMAAAAELARVAAPSARIVLSAWLPDGAISQTTRVAREAVAAALGAPTGPPPFAWHERDALAGLLEPHGFGVELEEHRLAFSGPSAAAYLEEVQRAPAVGRRPRGARAARRGRGAARAYARDPHGGERGSRRLPYDQPLRRGDRAPRGLSRHHRGSWRPHSAKSGCAAWALVARPLGSSQSSCRPRAVRSRK